MYNMSALIHTPDTPAVPNYNFDLDSTIMNSKITELATNKDLIQKITTAFENMPKNLSSMIQSFTTINGIDKYVNTNSDITLQQLIQDIQDGKIIKGGVRSKHARSIRRRNAPSVVLPAHFYLQHKPLIWQ